MDTKNYLEANWIKAYIVDVLPCLTALLYVLAVIYNVAFFSVFSIDVTDFLSFGEMLVSIIQPLLLLSIFLLLLLALAVYFVPTLIRRFNHRGQGALTEKKIKRLRYFVKFFHSSPFYKSFKLFAFSFLIVVPTYYILFSQRIIDNFDGRYSGFVPIFTPIFLTIILLVCKFIIRSKMTFIEQLKSLTLADKILTFILFFVFAVAVIYESGLRDGKTLLERDEVAFRLTLVDNSIYDNTRYKYIKHTNGRVFIYDKHSQSSLIFFEDNVLSLKINIKNVYKDSAIDYIMGNFVKIKK